MVGTVTLGFAGAALAAAVPASADPAFSFIQVGSDTTENVMDFFAGQVGGGVIGTYDAVNPLSQAANETITPAVASTTTAGAASFCSFTRPNGSGAGFKALDDSYVPGTFTITPTAPQQGCIQLSRSSGGPGSVSTTAGTPGSSLSTGNFVYIPFAIDAVTYVTGPTTATSQTVQCVSTTTGCTNGQITFTTTPTTISQTADFSVAQLQTLYGSCQPVTVGGTTYNPGSAFSFTSTVASPAVFTTGTASNLTAGQEVTLSGTVPGGFTAGTPYFVVAPTASTFELAATSGGTAIAGTTAGSGTVTALGNIDLYAPQAGSGTLSFWQTTMGVSAPQNCWHQTIVAGPAIGVSVEEHDGSAVASDPHGIAPNSIAKWIGMTNGVISPDVRHGSVLQSITVGTTPVPPTNAGGSMNVAGCLSGASFNQATCFPITREVFNVVDFYQVVNTPPLSGQVNNPAFSPVLAGLLAGSSSALCRATFTIATLGFGNIPANSTFPDTCGSTASTLRVQMNSTAAQG